MTSTQWRQRAVQCIPGGVNSPVRSFKHVGGEPLYFERGEGAYLIDVEGRRYLDFCLAFGPHLLGHSPPEVVAAIQKQAARAMSFGACHPLEIELAEEILKAFPFSDRVRLVNSGTEAVMTAVRVARGFTGRDKIVTFEGCYHGHSDGLLAKAGSGVAALPESSSKGIPRALVADTLSVRLDRLETLEEAFRKYPDQIALVLLEPIPANHGLWLPPKGHLKAILELAHRHGALVLFDEVISGFRVGLKGASGYYGLEPDLVTLGKIIGGGLPLAAVAGKGAVMDKLAPLGDVYQAGTLSGNPLACAAGVAVLRRVLADPPYAALDAATTAFVAGLREVLAPFAPVDIRHVGSLFWLHFDESNGQFPPEISAPAAKRFALFFRQALERGIYFAPSPYEVGFLSTAHTPAVLDEALEKLHGCRPE